MKDLAYLLALEYAYLTEKYDASMSPVRDERGVALIQGTPNYGACCRNAIKIRDMQIRRENITYKKWRECIVESFYIFDKMGIDDLIMYMKERGIGQQSIMSFTS